MLIAFRAFLGLGNCLYEMVAAELERQGLRAEHLVDIAERHLNLSIVSFLNSLGRKQDQVQVRVAAETHPFSRGLLELSEGTMD